jgi:bis(5'-nucleosyl)-tetraphosphatase (symmetrical)
MSVYAIGDVQGCYDSLRALLDKIRFDPFRDTLWFTGDLVNRGPQSLEVLRFVSALPNCVAVLGNHDLHCLAVAAGAAPAKKRDTLEPLLAAPDRDELLGWLCQMPLFHFDPTYNCALVHAGLLPQWDIPLAAKLAREAEALIRHSDRNRLFQHMYGDEPDHWDESLAGWARTRIIINAFTRLRYCHADGRLDLRPKMRPGDQPSGLLPWFVLPAHRSDVTRIIFGHWSTLGFLHTDKITALDSGCLWGGRLTAWRVDAPAEPVQVPCPAHLTP